jgi:hypothetical protein
MGVAGQPSPGPGETSALTKVMWFGIVQIAGLVVGWISTLYIFGLQFGNMAGFTKLPQNATQAQVGAALGPFFQTFSLVIPVDIAVGLVGAVVLTMGLRDLAKVDSSKFSVPWKLMVFLIVGSLVAGAGVSIIFNALPSVIVQAPPTGSATPSTAFFSAIGSLIFAGLIAAIGGILALIGLIGGQILGLWRVGSRYNETIIKLGGIFVIIPLLNIIAPILILVGAYQVKGRLSKPM